MGSIVPLSVKVKHMGLLISANRLLFGGNARLLARLGD
jgi:hypothetical protein